MFQITLSLYEMLSLSFKQHPKDRAFYGYRELLVLKFVWHTANQGFLSKFEYNFILAEG